MHFVTTGCKSAEQERRTKSTNIRAASTMRTPPHKSGAAPNWRVFCDVRLKSSSRYSLVHILPTSSSKSAPNVTALNILKCKTSSRYSLHAFCRQPFCRQLHQIEPWNCGNTPYFGKPRSHITPKKHRVSRPRAFSPVNSHASELLHFPTT